MGQHLVSPLPPNFIAFLTMIVNLHEFSFLPQSSQESTHHLGLSLPALLALGHSWLSMGLLKVKHVPGRGTRWFFALKIGLPSIFKGHWLCLEPLVLEGEFVVCREKWEFLGLDDARGESHSWTSHVVWVGLMHASIYDLLAKHMADVFSNLGPFPRL